MKNGVLYRKSEYESAREKGRDRCYVSLFYLAKGNDNCTMVNRVNFFDPRDMLQFLQITIPYGGEGSNEIQNKEIGIWQSDTIAG